jgi:hypothetical protein
LNTTEGGSDFAGIVEIDVNGDEVSREDMTYDEYQYEKSLRVSSMILL